MSRGASDLDVARVRGLFPGLSDGFVHADGPAGSLVPDSVIHAVSQAMRVPIAARGGVFPSSARAEALLHGARSAVADLVGARADGVVLGPDVTTLTWSLARVLARTWSPGDEIVVSRLDHDANVRPWVQLAERTGVLVRWAEVDIETGELPAWQYDELLTARTQLVAVTAASSAIGTRPDVAGIAARAHQVGALVYVDAAHAAAHVLLDQAELDADFLAVSAYKWGGPHVGAVVADPALLEQLWPEDLAGSALRVPDRFETGTPPFELYAGLAASVEHLADLVPGAPGARRDRLASSMAAVGRYETALFRRLERALRSMPHVQVLGAPAQRTPTLCLTVRGRRPRQVTSQLARRNVCAWDGDHHAPELFDALGVTEGGGAVRLGLMHFSSVEDVDHLVQCLADLDGS